MQRPTWILAFGLALLGAPAAAVPCGDDCQEQEDRDDSSIQLKPTQPSDGSDDASRNPSDELSPGLRKKVERPPGLRDDGRAREWRKRIATVPMIPTQRPGNASISDSGVDRTRTCGSGWGALGWEPLGRRLVVEQIFSSVRTLDLAL